VPSGKHEGHRKSDSHSGFTWLSPLQGSAGPRVARTITVKTRSRGLPAQAGTLLRCESLGAHVPVVSRGRPARPPAIRSDASGIHQPSGNASHLSPHAFLHTANGRTQPSLGRNSKDACPPVPPSAIGAGQPPRRPTSPRDALTRAVGALSHRSRVLGLSAQARLKRAVGPG
jgi:hypothetical protein